MDKKILITLFTLLLAIIAYNEFTITGYTNANVNVIVLKPLEIIVSNNLNESANATIGLYYKGINVEYNSYNVSGNTSIKINQDAYDIHLSAYDGRLYAVLYDINLSNLSSVSIGINKLNAGIGDIVTYAINEAFPINNASISISYNDLSYSDESNLRIFVCHQWDFSQENCISEFAETNAAQDTYEKKFTLNVSDLSAFALKEISKEAGAQEVDGGGIFRKALPELRNETPMAFPEKPETKLPAMPIDIFLKPAKADRSLLPLMIFVIFFILVYVLSRAVYKWLMKEKIL